MSRPPERRARAGWLFVAVAILSVAYATPWAATFRRELRPTLPIIVVVLGTLTGVWYLVTAFSVGVAAGEGLRAAAAPLALGLSSLCMAFIFLPIGHERALHDIALAGAIVLALVGLALVRRAPNRSPSSGERPESR